MLLYILVNSVELLPLYVDILITLKSEEFGSFNNIEGFFFNDIDDYQSEN